MTKQELGDEALAIANKIPEIQHARLSPAGDAVEIVLDPAEGATRVFLARLAARVEGMGPGARRDHILRTLTGVVETAAVRRGGLETWDTARLLSLRPMLFSADAYARNRDSMVATELVPGVAETIVLDRESTIAHLTSSQLAEWGVTVERARTAARENLAASPDTTRWQKVPAGPRMWQLNNADDYDCRRVFDPDWLRPNSPPGTGPLFFAVPGRQLVIAARLRDVESELDTIAERVLDSWRGSTEAVSPVLYVLDGDAVRPLRSKKTRVQRQLWHNAAALAVTVYSRQLEAIVPAEGENWHRLQVAELNGQQATLTSWTGDSTDDLLPQAEYVMIPPATDPVIVPWQDFLDVVGEHVQREHAALPARWRTCRALTTDQRRELRQRGIQEKLN